MLKYILPISLVCTPVQAFAFTPDSTKQIECLTQNAYHEAGGEGTKGIIAVTNVVMNRTKDTKNRFGSTPCQVIYQKSGGSCQFSWTCSKKAIRNKSLYEKCKEIVRQVYYKEHYDITGGALFYHAAHISDSWFKNKLKFTTRIGGHLFYKG